MLLDDIYDEVAESLGTCEEATIFSRVTRGIQLLANRGLFDPLIGYLDVHINDGYTFALPREVKTVIRANINSNPSFPRTKLFEFAMNTEGSNEGEEIGFNWSDRGFIPLQDETVLPSKLSYRCVSEEDVGKTCTVVGTDADGQEATATLIAALDNGTESTAIFLKVANIRRDLTTGDCYLDADDGPAARFYPDERQPLYRAIKFSKTAAAVRIMFRRRTFKITSREDFIPLHSEMAVILAARAASFWMQDQFATANAILDQATTLIKEEQASLDEAQSLSKEMDVQPTIDFNIRTRDCIIVADIYNEACNIVGPIGRENVFDAITDAIEVLGNEAHWDSTIGYADLVKMDNHERINFKGSKGDGLFCLPRMVEAVLGMNICGRTSMPRNKWHEFHLNGPGSMARASSRTWTDFGEAVTINGLKIDATTKLTVPSAIVAVPDVADDNDTEVRIFGYERLEDGSEKWIRVDGEDGMLVPCTAGSFAVDADLPLICRIERITKATSTGFIKLVTVVSGAPDVILGYYEPDELEPHYRIVQVPNTQQAAIRIRFRVRSKRISSLYQPIFLRSRLAVKTALDAIKKQKEYPKMAAEMLAMAVNYLRREQAINNPHNSPSIQVAPGTLPCVTSNEQVQ